MIALCIWEDFLRFGKKKPKISQNVIFSNLMSYLDTYFDTHFVSGLTLNQRAISCLRLTFATTESSHEHLTEFSVRCMRLHFSQSTRRKEMLRNLLEIT